MCHILNIETSSTNCSVSLSKNGKLISIKEENDENISDESILNQARKYYTGVGHTKNYEKAYGLFLPLF